MSESVPVQVGNMPQQEIVNIEFLNVAINDYGIT